MIHRIPSELNLSKRVEINRTHGVELSGYCISKQGFMGGSNGSLVVLKRSHFDAPVHDSDRLDVRRHNSAERPS